MTRDSSGPDRAAATISDCYPTVDCAGVEVRYAQHLDGGGNDFGRAYVPFVEATFGRVGSVLEWCSGPGFIGFSLLGNGLCDQLGLTDVNAEAVSACRATVRGNGLDDRVSLFHGDCLDGMPEDRRWDLIVGNPPHMDVRTAPADDVAVFRRLKPELVYADHDWEVHRRFYRRVGELLAPGGSVVLQECSAASSAETFRDMITDGGLEVAEVIPCDPPHDLFYFLWVRKPAG
ncbi:methyltransferase [Saccharopolyspora sp. NPDC002578]